MVKEINLAFMKYIKNVILLYLILNINYCYYLKNIVILIK